jgi:putative ABC transport system permease protein
LCALKWTAAISEGLEMAWNALVKNKLRSILSVLGITIGIYCIIAVYAMVHSMEKNLNDSFASYGTDVLFVQKWPWDEIGGEYPWWKYMSRPQTSAEEAEFLEANMNRELIAAVAFTFGQNLQVGHKEILLSNVRMSAISFEYNAIQKVDVENGRYFTNQEMTGGHAVAIIGATIAQNLFKDANPLGKMMRVKGVNCQVIGVCRKEGKTVLGNSADEQIFVPVRFATGLTNYKRGEKGSQIMIKAADGVSLELLRFEVTQVMRRYRRLRLASSDDFAVNTMSMITNVISNLFAQIRGIGFIIGGFSMLVGCFGVANIMFVSVKERTQEIGIQKALGAKRRFILTQFLIESVLLCLLGGVIGLLLVWGTLAAMNYGLANYMESAIRLYLSSSDISVGIWVSVIVGILAGFLPALSAAKMDPVEAIRSK